MDPSHFESASWLYKSFLNWYWWLANYWRIFFLFLMAGGAHIVLIVLVIIIITSSPNIFEVLELEHLGCWIFLSVSSRRKLPRSPSIWYRPTRIALFEISAGRWYARCTSLAFGSFLAFNYTQVLNSSYLVAHSIHIRNEVLTRGRNLNSLLGSDLLTGNIIAFRLKFTE